MTDIDDDPMSEATLKGKVRGAAPVKDGRSGTLVVVLIVVWTIVLLATGLYFAKQLVKDPCWDHGTGAPLPASCSQAGHR